MSPHRRHQRSLHGFTLVEVLVALGIVAIALVAGTQASSALLRNAGRQSDVLLGQICAENELSKARLARQLVDEDVAQIALCPLSIAVFATRVAPEQITYAYHAPEPGSAGRLGARNLLEKLVARAAGLARLR